MQNAFSSRTMAPHFRAPAQRPAVIVRSLVGDTGPGAGNSDPEKVRQQKEKKHSEGQWAEPHNKNKLEKKTLVHGVGSEATDTKGAADAIKEGAKKIADAVNPKK